MVTSGDSNGRVSHCCSVKAEDMPGTPSSGFLHGQAEDGAGSARELRQLSEVGQLDTTLASGEAPSPRACQR